MLNLIIITARRRHSETVRPNSSTPWSLSLNPSIRAQSPTRKRLPQQAEVLAPSQNLVSRDDSITSLEERRAARLQLHSVDDQLHAQRVTVLGDEGLASNSGAVEVARGYGAVLERSRGEEVLCVPVLLDEALGDDPEDLSPDFTDGVDTPVAGLVEGLVHRGVNCFVLQEMSVRTTDLLQERTYRRVDVVTDTLLPVGSPSTHSIVRVHLVASNSRSQEVSPSFTHSSTLTPSKAVRVQGTTSQTGAQTVAEFVDDDTGLEITISVGNSGVPEVHAHATVLTIGWGHEVGIVVSGTVLGVGDNTIVLASTTAKVVLLEVTRHLIEAITVVEIVDQVGGVEELGDGSVDVLLGLLEGIGALSLLGSVLIIEHLLNTTIRAVVVDVRVLALPVLLSKYLEDTQPCVKREEISYR